MPTFVRVIALAFCFLLFVSTLHAQQEYLRWWQYENRAEKLTPEQFNLTTQLAQQGDVDAEMLLAVAYRKGFGVEKNTKEYLVWLQRAAEHGAPEAQLSLSLVYRRGTESLKADPQQSLTWLRRAADQGHMMAMHNLGSAYLSGIPDLLPPNIAQAELWLTRSAESGFTHAQFILGDLYFNPKYGRVDVAKAEMWLRKASEHGHSLAMTLLARLYSSEDGPPRDPDFVERILLRGSEMRRPETQYMLARMYRNGYLGAVNLPAALEWLQISAGKKYAPSAFMLGEMHEKGEGVPANATTAAQHYLEAAVGVLASRLQGGTVLSSRPGHSPGQCRSIQVVPHRRSFGRAGMRYREEEAGI